MRSRVAVAGVVVAVAAAVGGIGLAIAAAGAPTGSPAPSPSHSASAVAEQVSSDDFCYVEAMIYYRVEAADLANAVLGKTGIGADTRALATRLARVQTSELEDLRPWYVSWTGSRPLERPQEGPCAGHGVTHTQMPGLPTPSQWAEFTAVDGEAAERIFLDLLIAQDTAMVDFASLVLDGDPHPRAGASAEQVVAEGAARIVTLEDLLAQVP